MIGNGEKLYGDDEKLYGRGGAIEHHKLLSATYQSVLVKLATIDTPVADIEKCICPPDSALGEMLDVTDGRAILVVDSTEAAEQLLRCLLASSHTQAVLLEVRDQLRKLQQVADSIVVRLQQK